jgi:lipopolysaccharide/colanic/teichoic acid biosynthesis glycosyltransferase
VNVNSQIHSQAQFRERIAQEWRRAERSGRPALLILFEGLPTSHDSRRQFLKVLSATFRETDVFGWFVAETSLGVIFLELGKSSVQEAQDAIWRKVRERVLSSANSFARGICATAHVLPPYVGNTKTDESHTKLADELWRDSANGGSARRAVLRMLDICGSSFLLLALSPVLLVIGASIRMTSRGPALFRQTRAGLSGRPFVFFKFRTMEVGTDNGLHQDYVRRFINGDAEQHLDGNGQPVYKLTNDSRVTRIGRILRKTSLDELPQLWNVLHGEMSLVGPRPPLPYEVECYDLWHRRRVYELKPGLTGLWQVRGRSRCSFDEMIRMDLQHGGQDSLALYFKVLLETPLAVIHGSGAH